MTTSRRHISKITINDFRAFPVRENYELELPGGKNLLLYGENGSGKSSFFRALRELLNLDLNAKPFQSFKNVFSSQPGRPYEDGVVGIEVFGGTPLVHTWTYGGARPTAQEGQQFWEIARRATFLDYKSLLQTNFLHEEEAKINLFPLMMQVLLKDAIHPGTGRKIAADWDALTSALILLPENEEESGEVESGEMESPDEQVNEKAAEFRENFATFMALIVGRANQFLNKLSKGLVIELSVPEKITVTKLGPPHEFEGAEIQLTATYGNFKVEQPAQFLNEARLSAIALSIYLASTLQTFPALQAGQPQFPQILALDDVLIGLDLSHRLPLLELLEEHFKDWQIFLITYDKVWFEMAQLHLELTGKWLAYEMYAEPVSENGTIFEAPLVMPDRKFRDSFLGKKDAGFADYFLAKAREQLNVQHNDRPAGMYTRAAFEVKVKKYCEKHSIRVPFSMDQKKLDTEDFLGAIEEHVKAEGMWGIVAGKIARVRMFRKGVLNPLSHSSPTTIVRGEVEGAIEAVEKFNFTAQGKTAFQRAIELSKLTLTDLDRQEFASCIRGAFEFALREFCKIKTVCIPFRDDFSSLTVNDIWNAAKPNIPDAAFVTDIETERRFFLDDFDFGYVSTLIQTQIQSFLTILQDATVKTKTKLG